MGIRSVLSLFALAIPAQQVLGATYTLRDNFTGSKFFSGFTHEALGTGDPTHGRVNYVSESVARSQNLSYASDANPPHFIMRSDFTSTLSSSGPGRNAVRIHSNNVYGANTVMVADINHMPQGCGSWPALWTLGPNWPNGGEIDIIEGVNDHGANAQTLHTSSGCTQPTTRSQTGTTQTTDCNALVNGNTGCGVLSNKANSYGPSFNNVGGGWYAIERTNTNIKIWFWARNEGGVPSDVTTMGSGSVNPANWGTPVANFVNNSCDFSSKFGSHQIIINLTFCGDWAGQQSIYAGDGCPGTCVDYVNNNPAAFKNAYWDFKALRTYSL